VFLKNCNFEKANLKNANSSLSSTFPLGRTPRNPRKSLFLSALLLLIIAQPVSGSQYKVTRVHDGDTITVRAGSSELTLRLVGIDAPETSKKKREPGQPSSQQATKHLAGLVLNKVVEIKEYGHDRYGRTLAVVFLEGKNINLEMVKAGLAEVYRGGHATTQILTRHSFTQSGKRGDPVLKS
jgi:endonuclease YncB( thermonuclease family)